jgi:hypothetical protein
VWCHGSCQEKEKYTQKDNDEKENTNHKLKRKPVIPAFCAFIHHCDLYHSAI